MNSLYHDYFGGKDRPDNQYPVKYKRNKYDHSKN